MCLRVEWSVLCLVHLFGLSGGLCSKLKQITISLQGYKQNCNRLSECSGVLVRWSCIKASGQDLPQISKDPDMVQHFKMAGSVLCLRQSCLINANTDTMIVTVMHVVFCDNVFFCSPKPSFLTDLKQHKMNYGIQLL